MTRSLTKKIKHYADSTYRGPKHVDIPRLATRAVIRPKNMPAPVDPYHLTRPRNKIYISPRGRRKSAEVARAHILSILHSASPEPADNERPIRSEQLPTFANSNDTPMASSSSAIVAPNAPQAGPSSSNFALTDMDEDSGDEYEVIEVDDTSEEEVEYEGKGKGKMVDKPIASYADLVNRSKLATAHGIEYELRKMRNMERREEREMFDLGDSDKENIMPAADDHRSAFKNAWNAFEKGVWSLTDSFKEGLDTNLTSLMRDFQSTARVQARVDNEADVLGCALVTSGQQRIDTLEGEKQKMEEEIQQLREELAKAKAEVKEYRDALAPLQKLSG